MKQEIVDIENCIHGQVAKLLDKINELYEANLKLQTENVKLKKALGIAERAIYREKASNIYFREDEGIGKMLSENNDKIEQVLK